MLTNVIYFETLDSVAVPGIPLDLDKSKKRGKDGVRRALELVQHSTQSLGRSVFSNALTT